MPDETEQIDPKPIGELKPTPTASDVERYRRLAKERPVGTADLQIESSGLGRRLWRVIGWTAVLLACATLFVILFYRFTNNLRVALIVVSAMGAYMFLASRLAEGRFDRRNN